MNVPTRKSPWFRFLVAAGVCAGSGTAIAHRSAPAPPTGTFNHIVFTPANGRVGYHMFAGFGVYDSDEPTGNNSSCLPRQIGTIATGTLPPGLAWQDVALAYGFDGTPRQPGDWTVHVVIPHIQCTVGPDQTDYGPRSVDVHFHIDP